MRKAISHDKGRITDLSTAIVGALARGTANDGDSHDVEQKKKRAERGSDLGEDPEEGVKES